LEGFFAGFGRRFFTNPLSFRVLCTVATAGGDQKKPLQNVGDPSRSVLRMGLFDLHHPLLNLPRYPGFAARWALRLKAFDAPKPVGPDPSLDRMGADSELFSKQVRAVLFLQEGTSTSFE